MTSLAIIGCGTMGEAILTGLLHANVFTPAQIHATVRRPEPAQRLRDTYGVTTSHDNTAACAGADVVLLAVKPQFLADLLDDDRMRAATAGKLVISIAAGVRLATLGTWLPEAKLVRAMPNTPCLVSRGMTVLAPGPRAAASDLAIAQRIFAAVGRVIELEDKHMDAVTSLNGSGPAFAYVMLEALADGGVMMGLRRDVALEIAAQVFLGSATMVLDTKLHPAALKDQVTTPAGSTIAGLLTMEDGRIRSVLARTIQEAAKVAASLGGPAKPEGQG
jgi:pyrroline-5-carboxylate reductase